MRFSRSGCPPFVDDPSTSWECRQFNQGVSDWIAGQKSLRLVFLASRWAHHRERMQASIQGNGRAAALSKTLALLNKLKLTPVILGQVPDFGQSVPLCVARARFYGRAEDGCVVKPVAQIKELFLPVDDYFRTLRQQYAFVLVSPLSAFCDDEWCHAVDNGNILIMDSHVTEAGALRTIPYLKIPGLFSPFGAAAASSGANDAASRVDARPQVGPIAASQEIR
jgi:hypothetical protein